MLLFEDHPVWLLTLNSHWISQIYIPQHSTAAGLLLVLPHSLRRLYKVTLSRLGPKAVFGQQN